MTPSEEMLKQEFLDPEARADYAELFLNSSIALQIKILRQQEGRDWTQKELAELAGLHQSQISAMEQASHSGWKVSTLNKLAKAFDLALVVRFESFGALLNDVTSANRKALERPSFKDDPAFREESTVAQSLRVIPPVVDIKEYVSRRVQSGDRLEHKAATQGAPILVTPIMEDCYG